MKIIISVLESILAQNRFLLILFLICVVLIGNLGSVSAEELTECEENGGKCRNAQLEVCFEDEDEVGYSCNTSVPFQINEICCKKKGLPDLNVQHIKFINLGNNIYNIYAIFKNEGKVLSFFYDYKAYINDKLFSYKENLASLNPGEEIEFLLGSKEFQIGDIVKVVVDPEDKINEEDEVNNNKEKKFTGSFCGDGYCDSDEELTGSCSEDCECIREGGTIPVISNPPKCCNGLKLIKPKFENLMGINGYCTAKCGNDVCEAETESSYNCPEDCKDLQILTCNSCEDCSIKIGMANPGTTVKLVNNISGTDCIVWPSGKSYVSFDCSGHSITQFVRSSGAAIKMRYLDDNGRYNTIKNCVISGHSSGILLWNIHNSWLINNTFNRNGVGIYLWNSYGNFIEDNSFFSGGRGIFIQHSYNVTIANNEAKYNTGPGIYIEMCWNHRLINNKLAFNDIGIYFRDYTIYEEYNKHLINNNVITDNRVVGVKLEGVRGNLLDSNYVCDNQDFDIYDAGLENRWYNNKCDNVFIWDDKGAEDCTFKCLKEPITSEKLPGDLNNDGVIDIFDFGIVAADFGKTSGYNQRADTDSNGVIDIFDVVFVARRLT